MGTKEKTSWWTWVQLVALLVSIVANVVLWHQSTDLERRLRLVDLTDRTWNAFSAFENSIQGVKEELDSGFRELLLMDPLEEEWMEDAFALDEIWLSGYRIPVEELRTKIDAYRLIGQIDVQDRVIALSTSIVDKPPSERAAEYLEGRLAELTTATEFFYNAGQTELPREWLIPREGGLGTLLDELLSKKEETWSSWRDLEGDR